MDDQYYFIPKKKDVQFFNEERKNLSFCSEGQEDPEKMHIIIWNKPKSTIETKLFPFFFVQSLAWS